MTSLFGHSVRSDLLLLYVADALICFLAVSALLAWQGGVPVEQGGALAVGTAGAAGLIGGATGLYRPEAFGRLRQLLAGLAVGCLLLLVLLPVFALLGPGEALRGHLSAVPVAFVGALVTTRLGFTAARRRGMLRRRLAVLRMPEGTAPDFVRLNAAIARQGSFVVALKLDADARLEGALDPARLRAERIWGVILPDGAALPAALRQPCTEAGIRLLEETTFIEHQLARVDVERLREGWLARSNALREGRPEAAARRGLDILLGATLVLATLPLLLLTALAIKLDSPGPVFYRQERVGRGGRVFMLFKFRSMVADAEKAGAPVWASKRDTRVTRVGRFIRLTRIDEIPQVLNVLRGDMAFVGPRPERPAFVEKLAGLIPHYGDRAVVKPGITGWAQVNFPYGASVEDARMKLAYDLYYVRRRSLFLDLLILVATVRVVLFQEGSR
ncbi:exopolysaccharide biosynthesis polyprenyl glycosylphosphotransferase [Paracraurococcus lichenis]|uniref:Exopolysaccharide biosynthesis polyprenyl glycosylphosphotransferase n=1 Tax=Paracraurococcus lichenis TaxID=3064888 RepID=A0ABT9EA60_9PROT|nr:exopolysaccharide biosynthesis polyprenyl glycosylphosphotransferase [Paracraurococcus sp. LOR1-02]MDO9713092.1 exopolysaccharide biosynthesis polyprenyl glycosylphosphotransferase [Paracraurococcus sp. LOR1-02]